MKAFYVTDRAAAPPGRFEEVLEARSGSPDLSVQLREKAIPDGAYLALALRCGAILGPETPLFVNGRFDVALAAGAAGVHLPEAGLPLERVRAQTPRGFRVGASTHSAAGAARLLEQGADVVFVGPVFETPSKPGLPLGPSALDDLPPRAGHSAEVYAIGGITEGNLDALEAYRDRISGIAAIRLFQESPDPAATARRIACR
ncbi:MAG TPA: thiamine phosphate synthase [Gemmatimonadota bacterium]|nr:thiamine phosphate synthase [Gemmatimonadota bacterium]